jgi:hypothetical protein
MKGWLMIQANVAAPEAFGLPVRAAYRDVFLYWLLETPDHGGIAATVA